MSASANTARMKRSDALSLWHRVTLETVIAQGPDLSTRQLAILMSVYLESTSHTVKSLSEKLNVTKAVISRALDTLSKYGFVARAPDPSDKRSIIVTRTSAGILFLQRFADIIQSEIHLGDVSRVAA
ncbi:MarR family transcriptional regulator [Hellea balneolensis]|uniref:MarR family transcriptional regulator n=1 Tax=Hellea balneolensis TaxID=287478 RepID=UPI0003F50B99|nr:MarR family transcriptional regulator [Hellea balneolensis]